MDAHAPVHGDRSGDVKAAAIALIVLPTIAVFARYWQVVLERSPWWHDLFITITLILSNAVQAVAIWWAGKGFGRHASTVPRSGLQAILDGEVVELTLYGAALSFLKFSVLLSYANLFKIERRFARALWILGGVVFAWFVTMMLEQWLKCDPPIKFVKPQTPGTCHAKGVGWILSQAVINFVLDLIILVLPMPLVWGLNMKVKQKFQVTVLFIVGYASAFISLGRFIIIASDPSLITGSSSKGGGNPDVTYTLVPLFLLTMIETPLGLIALCMIPIHKLISRSRRYGFRSLFSKRLPVLHSGHTGLVGDRTNASSVTKAPSSFGSRIFGVFKTRSSSSLGRKGSDGTTTETYEV